MLARYHHHGRCPTASGSTANYGSRSSRRPAASAPPPTNCATTGRGPARAGRAAAAEDCALLATGTPIGPGHGDPPAAGTGRYAEIDAAYGAVVSDYEACGCHVHVGVPDRDTGVAVLNHLAPWLPTLLALSVNSPFDRGRDTGYGSWRIVLQSRFPGFGTPPHFTSYADYQRCVDTLVDCGVLVDNNQSFWLARPSGRYPTVELRVADTALTVDGALLQALLGRALINTALCALDRGREAVPVHPQIAAAAVWSAARYGPTGQAIDVATGSTVAAKTMVTRLVDLCRDALDATGDLTTVHTLLDQLRQTGTGADRQRAVVGAGPAALHRMLHERTLEFGDRNELTRGIPGHDDDRVPACHPGIARRPWPVVGAALGRYCAIARTVVFPASVGEGTPFGDDLQLALHLCYELHYQGFAGVAADWEWDPDLLRFRGVLERTFLAGMRDDVAGGTDVDAALDEMLVEPVRRHGAVPFPARRR